MKWYPWLRLHFEKLIIGYHEGGWRHHAILVQALPGMGDDVLIYAITRFLMCQKTEKYKSCGRCRSCLLMQAGTHPDYYTLEPEKGKSTIGIDTVRDIRKKLCEYARMGGLKVVWVNDATCLTESAGNALLKTLEEPPEKTWFFLSCRKPGEVLATLYSRCSLYRLTVPQEELAISWLQREVKVSVDTATSALRLCSGAPVAALELLQKNYWIHRGKLCLALGKVLETHDWFSLLTVLNHEHAPVYLQWLIALLLDALKLQQKATIATIINVDAWPLLNNLARVLPGATLHVILHALCHYREQLLTIAALDRELLLTDLLLIIEHYLQPGTILPTLHI